MLSVEEKNTIADCVAGFAMRLFLAANSEENIQIELQDFYNLFCGALEVARRDGRVSAMTTTTN